MYWVSQTKHSTKNVQGNAVFQTGSALRHVVDMSLHYNIKRVRWQFCKMTTHII